LTIVDLLFYFDLSTVIHLLSIDDKLAKMPGCEALAKWVTQIRIKYPKVMELDQTFIDKIKAVKNEVF
jgi:hypothetical protein